MNRICYVTLCLIIFSNSLFAQAIDNVSTYKNINTDNYFRINYENDFFSAADIYYTQGVSFELVAPSLKHFPLSWLLVRPKYDHIRYGIGVEHDAYTPTSIGPANILYGDRPFAAALFLKTFLIATDAERKQRFSTTLITGVVGQAAFGAEMQTGIHRALHDITPHGWPNQIHNDAAIDYEVEYEKQLVSVPKFFSVNGDGRARAGTLSDKAAIGATVMGGYFNDPFVTDIIVKGARIYAYDHADIAAIGYDATMQGGVFDHTSPLHHISKQYTARCF